MTRRQRAGGALILAAGFGLTLFACVDLFHPTNFETLCDVDPDASACEPGEASSPLADASAPPFDGNFCGWDEPTARERAATACAWLGACAGPIADNAFGECVVRAMLAYDCTANPNRALLAGPAHDYWEHLARATSCDDVLHPAILPPNTNGKCTASATAYAGCLGDDAGTLLECSGDDGGTLSMASFESCAAFGQACAASGATAACAGASGVCTVDGTSCDGTKLHDCESSEAGAFDQGIDCADFGAGACASGSDGVSAACAPVSDAGCTPTSAVTCGGDDGNLAIGCPAGLVEQVDCSQIMAQTYDPQSPAPVSCTASAPGRPWDVSRACSAGTACAPDSCNGSVLNSCARGLPFSFDCAPTFAGCTLVSVPDDAVQHAACVGAP